MADETEAEFYEDFGYSLRPADVEQLLERARATGDREVRLLAKQYLTLRRVAAALLYDLEHAGFIQPRRSGDSDKHVVGALGLLRFLLNDEPHTPRT